MICKVSSAGLWGLDGFEVSVEAFFGKGDPNIEIIGLPDISVKESLNRIQAVCQDSKLAIPSDDIIVNLAPADRKKQGSSYDLAILIALLGKTVLRDVSLDGSFFFGELSLSGEIKPCKGALCMCISCKENGAKRVFVPKDNEKECSVVDGVEVYGASNVIELIEHLKGKRKIKKAEFDISSKSPNEVPPVDFCDIKGQESAKRAAEISAAGGHNLLLVGPPGSGKSLISKAIPGILPEMSFKERLECTKIYSVSGMTDKNTGLISVRPFRSPHHTMSFAGLAGGGNVPSPGEITLCHNGVLFLDELPEFEKRSLEILRQPLEDKRITITRAAWKETFPADFMLVCAMNPCPCGYYGSDGKKCICSPKAVEKYLSKISGPLLDRIDIRVEVPAISFDELNNKKQGESSAEVRKRVNAARKIAEERYKEYGIKCNGNLSGTLTKKFCIFDSEAEALLKSSFISMNMSARGYDRLLRIARTIADLSGEEMIREEHILEAVQFRTAADKYFK